MNEANYCTREATKRLQEAGITMETDFYWYDDYGKFFLAEKSNYRNPMQLFSAPCMAEVWRELPQVLIDKNDELEINYHLTLQAGIFKTIGVKV